ncbi:MAG TPA: glycosyltransferase [Solirubrobacterales bacterium]|jgi:glycosyltransferase involved in cell wall biosynthesis
MSGANGPGPAVDIVINNYNYARFLPDAIESASGQAYDRVKTIVVDDGSTDGSRRLLHDYEDRVTVVLKENGGQASALNAGMERCEGDVVLFLDADDTLHPQAAGRVAAAFAADDRLAKVQFRMETIDADGQRSGELKPPAHLPMPRGDLRRAELAYPFDLAWLPTSANAFRVDALRRILPIPERAYPVCGADWYLIHLMTLLGTVTSLEEVSGYYRVHGANSYEPASPSLDLAHVRETIGYARVTADELLRLADELELPRPQRILSLADLGNRLVSLRLEPRRHPIPSDRAVGLLLDAARAARRRSNVSAAMKLAFLAWFATVTLAPRPLVRRLAVLFLFPQSRASLNDLLGRLQGRRRKATAPQG